MSDNFDWQTEDELEWEDFDSEPQPTAVTRKPTWRTILIVLGLVAVAGLVLNWQYNRRLEALTATIELDVLSTHNLINRAVHQQDLELLAPLLSAKKLSWTKAQEQLMQQSLFQDRSQFDLTLANSNLEDQNLAVDDGRYLGIEVAPDLNEVILSFNQEYVSPQFDDPVWLQQTAVYRRGRSRWLLSPPSDEFWGEWQTIEMEHLSLVYPERDNEVVERLAEDLSHIINQTCQKMASDDICPADFQVQLRLDSDPNSLLAVTDPTSFYDGNMRLELPAPTLVGLPQDEPGYQSILLAYSAPMISVIVTEGIGWECCAQAPVYQAFMDYHLAQLGLRPWPVTRETYINVVNSGTTLDDVYAMWLDLAISPADKTENWKLYAFVDYLMRQPDAPSSLAMLQSFLEDQQTFQSWLVELFGSPFDEPGFMVNDRISRDWWLDAQVQMLISQEPIPLPFPDQDLMLACGDGSENDQELILYRHILTAGQWQPLAVRRGFLFIAPLPEDNAIVINSFETSSDVWQTELLQNERRLLLYNDEFPFSLSWGQVNAPKEQLLVFMGQDFSETLQPMLADVPACREGDCLFTPLSGVPIWSPSGRHSIIIGMDFLDNNLIYSNDGRTVLFDAGLYFQNLQLFRGNALGEVEISLAEGNLPFWVDDETYGYVSTMSPTEGTQSISLASVADDLPVSVATTAELLASIPEDERPFRLSIRFAYPYPQDPDLLFVVANSRLDSFLFIIDLKNNLVENPIQFPSIQGQSFGISPDGRYVLVSGAPTDDFIGPQNVITYYLYDISRNKTKTFVAGMPSLGASYAFDWSADGNWLAMFMNNSAINLVAPAYNYQYLLQHEKGECSSLAWVNPGTKQP